MSETTEITSGGADWVQKDDEGKTIDDTFSVLDSISDEDTKYLTALLMLALVCTHVDAGVELDASIYRKYLARAVDRAEQTVIEKKG